MKKFTRSEKLKVLEAAKTILIVLLFLLCLFLGYRILNLYKAQTNVEGALWGSMGGSAEVMESGGNLDLKAVCDTPYPLAIAANTNTARKLIDSDSQMFEDISKLTNRLICEAYAEKNENIFISDMQNWYDALKTDSLYIKYPTSRFLNTESELYGVKPVGLWSRIKFFNEVIFVRDNNQKDAAEMLVIDCDRKNVIRIKLSDDKTAVLKEKTKKINLDEEKKYVFAWELNLDKNDESNRAALDPMLLMPVDEEDVQTISVSVPRLYKAGLNFTRTTDLTLGFVNAFNYNPNTIRQYVNQDNSIMFVGETGSLNLHPDGVVEYKALDAEDGVPLSSEKNLDGIMRGLCAFLEKIMRIVGINTANADFSARLTEMPQSFKPDNVARLCFDYFVADKRVEFPDSYGISAVVKNGNLVELKMHLKNIQAGGGKSVMPALFDELDKFRTQNPELSKISDVYGVYKYSGEAEDIEAEWKLVGVR